MKSDDASDDMNKELSNLVEELSNAEEGECESCAV
jgi:hypothetical protein